MTLKEQLLNDMKTAMKEKDKVKLAVIRMLRSSIKNMEIDRKSEFDDDQVLEVIQKEIKKRKESIDGFKKGDRQDLVDKEEAEMKILYDYLPSQASDEEVKAVVKEIVDSLPDGARINMGMIMPRALEKLKGRADGKRISFFAKEFL
ncbi:MAG: GatB/YqeY domain-containing protein [Vulcanimicrobiota bacterium]